jgi:hypothetical protein
MRTHLTFGRRPGQLATAIGVIAISFAGCTAAMATPSGATVPASPTPPIICDDGPNAHTPMPADCVIQVDPRMPSSPPTFPYGAETTAGPTSSPPSAFASVPPATAWHGKTFYTPPAGTGSRLIGIGPDDTLYVMLERALPWPKPTPTGLWVAADTQASVIALRPDGSMRPGWSSDGIPIAGFPMSYRVNAEGTLFVASSANPYGPNAHAQNQMTVTAIGSDGKVLPGWPYRTPGALQPYDPELLVSGPDGEVCFVNHKPGVTQYGGDNPMVVYCLGRDGKLLPGWPYVSDAPLWNLAVGPDGTAYVGQKASNEIVPGTYVYPYQVLALGRDGKPKPGWVPWNRSDVGITTMLPTKDGRIYILLGGDSGTSHLVVVDSTGKTLDDRVESTSTLTKPNYKDVFFKQDGSLFVSVNDERWSTNVVNVYSPDGSQMAGWPQPIGGWGDIAVAADRWVWVEWTVYDLVGHDDRSAVALFDSSGNLQPGYPMASDFLPHLGSFGLEVASDGTAYATACTLSGSRIVVFER